MKNNAPGAERMTFRNKYLAVLTATLLLFSICAQSQVRTGVRQKNLSKGIDFKELTADSLFRLPKDTLRLLSTDSGSLAYKGGVVWVFNGKADNCNCQRWDTASGKGGGNGKIYKEGFGIKITGPSIDSIKVDTAKLPSLNVEGLGSIKKKNDSTIQVNYSKSIAELRARAAFGDTIVYSSIINNIPSEWYYDPTDVTSPDDGYMILVAGGKRLKRYVDNFINAKWFGAKGNNSDDDGPALQAAIDWIIAHPSYTRTLYIPRGTYKINNPLIVYKWDALAGNYAAACIDIEGEKTGSFTDGAFNTIIRPTFNNSFALGFQRGKSCRVSGIYFTGVADGNGSLTRGTYAAFVQRPFDTYMAGLTRDTRYDPYQGIGVDMFSSTIPTDGGFPGLSSYYRGSPGGSSDIVISDCKIFGFTVAIGLGLSGSPNNTEAVIMERISFGFTKVCVASGHDQAKANFLRNFIAWDWIHTVLDGITYGAGYSIMPYVDGGNIAFTVNRLINFYDSGRFPVYIANVFAESLWQFGDLLGNQQSVVENCTFDFSTTPINANVPSPDAYMRTSSVLFKGCMFRLYDGERTRFAIQCSNTSFNNCSFNELPLSRTPDQYGFQQVTYQNTNLFIVPSIVGPTGSTITQPGNGDVTLTLGSSFQFTNSIGIANGNLITRVDDPFSEGFLNLGTYTVSIDSATATGSVTFDLTKVKIFQVGDYLFDVDSRLYIKISAINTSTGVVTLAQAPFSMRSGSKPLYLDYVRRLGASFTGSTTAGSPVITNVNTNGEPSGRYNSNLFGYPDFNIGTNQGSFVVSYDATAHTVTMNLPASSTKTQVQFENPIKISRTMISQNEPALNNLYVNKGTEWIVREDVGSNTKDKKYMFIKGGYTVPAAGWQQQAVWELETNGGIPGGSDQNVQINDAGVFGGNSGLTYNKTSHRLAVDSFYAAKGRTDSLLLGTGIIGQGAMMTIRKSGTGGIITKTALFQADTATSPGNTFGHFYSTLDGNYTNYNDGHVDYVSQIGYNQDGNGGRKNPNEAEIHLAIESDYQTFFGADPNFEVHLESTARNGNKNRHFTTNISKTDGSGSASFSFDGVKLFNTNRTSDTAYFGAGMGSASLYGPSTETVDIFNRVTGMRMVALADGGFSFENLANAGAILPRTTFQSKGFIFRSLAPYDAIDFLFSTISAGGYVASFKKEGVNSYLDITNAGNVMVNKDLQHGATNDGSALQVGGTATVTAPAISDSSTKVITSAFYHQAILAASATLDFPSTSAQSTSGLNISVPGASVGDAVAVGYGNASTLTGHIYSAYVSSSNVVTVVFLNGSASSYDPGSATFTVRVIK